jgi:hypothetical protein
MMTDSSISGVAERRKAKLIMYRYARITFISLGLACVSYAQSPTPSAAKPDNTSSAYYNFAMAHLYGELASAYGNRGEYVNKASTFINRR